MSHADHGPAVCTIGAPIDPKAPNADSEVLRFADDRYRKWVKG